LDLDRKRRPMRVTTVINWMMGRCLTTTIVLAMCINDCMNVDEILGNTMWSECVKGKKEWKAQPCFPLGPKTPCMSKVVTSG
jgi:hypothetical protein